MANLINKDKKIVTVDSEETTAITYYDHPHECEFCNMNRTCHDLHVSILNAKSADIKRVWFRNAGKFGIAKTSLFTKIINLKKMGEAIQEFDLINGTWKEV